MGAAIPILEEMDQKKLEQKQHVKDSSILEDMFTSAVTIQKIVQSLWKSVWKMQKGINGMSNIYEAQNHSFLN